MGLPEGAKPTAPEPRMAMPVSICLLTMSIGFMVWLFFKYSAEKKRNERQLRDFGEMEDEGEDDD